MVYQLKLVVISIGALLLFGCGEEAKKSAQSQSSTLNERQFEAVQEQINAYQNHTNNEIKQLRKDLRKELAVYDQRRQAQLQEVVDKLQADIETSSNRANAALKK